MKLPIHSLFLKIFLWFWATLIATGIALILTFFTQHNAVPSRWHEMMQDAARSVGIGCVARLDTGGPAAALSYLRQIERDAGVRACLFDSNGTPVTGDQCPSFTDLSRSVLASGSPGFSNKFGIARAAIQLTGASGHTYIFATELPAGPRAAFGANKSSFLLEWGVAFSVSGLICYFLTRYLTAPILQLREASQRLAQGDLATRAAPGMERRQDELGRLVGDFNAMADRIESLISSQQQLISDISHELRSPLARLNVALDLVRERKGNDSSLDHMQADLEVLNEMAGRLLTVARLDTSPEPLPLLPVNLEELVTKIAHDAEFESQTRNGKIHLRVERPYWVQGNEELLHSAIENVVRNAIRYTDEGAGVDIRLEPASASVQLSVRDYGPGIPEAELANIFRPFYRVDNARDRQCGGAGLGLAISERVIRLHQGTIRAENVMPHGLQVNINLPELPRSSA
jgi:two-component system sensor histidine kinase CpxA